VLTREQKEDMFEWIKQEREREAMTGTWAQQKDLQRQLKLTKKF